jgi:tetratricopeptide (TPR) repeat protein
MKGIGNFKGAL